VTQTWTAPIIVWGEPSNLAIYDLTIDSSALAATRVANVIYSEGKVIRTELCGAGAATTNGAQDHVGLLAVGKSNAKRTKVRLSASLVHGFNKNGVRMFGEGLTGFIEFCTVLGAGRVRGACGARRSPGMRSTSAPAAGRSSSTTASFVTSGTSPRPRTPPGSASTTARRRRGSSATGSSRQRPGFPTGSAGLELVVATAAGKVHLLRNKGNGYLVNVASLTISGLGTPTSLASGDIDQKDQTDVVIGFRGTSTTNGGVRVLLAQGGALGLGATLGTFAAPVSYAIGKLGHGADAGDLDGDGDRDLVVTTSGDPGALHVFENDGKGVFREPAHSPFPIAADAQGVRIVDLQSDSDFDTKRIDVVVCHPTVHKITQLFAYGRGDFAGHRGGYTPLAPVVGTGCPGTSGWKGRIPVIYPAPSTAPLPTMGNVGFGIALRNARFLANSLLILTEAEKTAPARCGILAAPIFHAQFLRVSDQGTASVPLRVPGNPAFLGFDFWAQYVVADASGRYLRRYATTPGIRFRLGR
jgi:FG-GAP-like repeat